MDLALAVLDPKDADLIDFAAKVAARTDARLGVLVYQDAPTARIKRIKDADKPDNPHEDDHETAVLRAVFNATKALDNRDTTVYSCKGPKAHAAFAAAMSAAAADRLIIAASSDNETTDRAGMIKRLSRKLPAHLLIIQPGPTPPKTPARVIVPQLDGGGRHALGVTAPALLDIGAPLIAVADPKDQPRSARSFDRAKAKAAPGHRAHMKHITGDANSLAAATADAIQANDAVVIEIRNPGRLSAATSLAEKLHQEHDDQSPAVFIVRPAEAAGDTFVARQFQRVRTHLPVLEREHRIELTNRLESGGKLTPDFAIMLALSAGIAAFGLIQGSTAVVVGAMLVAPLMTPLVAAGLALVQGNARVFRQSLIAMGGGILGGLAVALIVGLMSPWDDLSAEVVSRTAPNLFDLGIAALSGFAAAYALARPGLAGTLAGVAIAVALVPPLGAIGIAAAKAEFALAFGAALLFATNLVAIILGASATFRFFGLQAAVSDAAVPLWVRLASVALITGGLVITIPLIDNQLSQSTDGVNRPLLLPLGPDLREKILTLVDQHDGIEILQMSRGGIEQDNRITVILACRTPAPSSLILDIETSIRTERGNTIDVMVIPVTVASVAP